MKKFNEVALFRLTVLGPLASRDNLVYGELKAILEDLATKTYNIPGTTRTRLSMQTIEKWYRSWLAGGIDALIPKVRKDKELTNIPLAVQDALIVAKKDNCTRSIRTIISMLENQKIVAKGSLKKSTVHRFLRNKNLSQRGVATVDLIERRAFVSVTACDLWQGDVLHGPTINTAEGRRKTYLVSFLDDKTRLIVGNEFCLGETALDIEKVLRLALLKRGYPKKILIDNGSAYISRSLFEICGRLKIRLIHSRPYEPQGKGKIERLHRTFREQFLNELCLENITCLADLNARLWAWTENVYNVTEHGALNGKTPLESYREDLAKIPQMQLTMEQLDKVFYHRAERKVRKDGTIQWNGKMYEVPHMYVDQTITIIIDPHKQKPLYIESDSGKPLEKIVLLDTIANLNRKRQRPNIAQNETPRILSAVELQYNNYIDQLSLLKHEEK